MKNERTPPVRLRLPWPPSVNNYWLRNRSGGLRVGPRGERFRLEVCYEVLKTVKPLGSISEPVAVSIVACQPDRRKRDLDNLLKATLDALTNAKVYQDDSLIHSLKIDWGEQVKDGRLDVHIQTIASINAALAEASENPEPLETQP